MPGTIYILHSLDNEFKKYGILSHSVLVITLIDDFKSPSIMRFFIFVLINAFDTNVNNSSTFFLGSIKIPFLFSTSQINYELSKKTKRFSDFKNQLKERKKLALLFGKLSRKNIQKTLKKASQLSGKKNDNFFSATSGSLF